jgi:hypothetical protein
MLVLPFGEESDMSISTNFRSSLRQSDLHTSVERQGLALGAARERASRAASLSREHERRDRVAVDSWENEGGAPSGTAAPLSKREVPGKLSALQLSAHLFRDDTLLRAVILNGILVLIAGAALLVLLNS